ncbi:amyloid fiber anchoring/assembly protein TapA [Robertmurraya yapensis]|uniref:Amyloid fiber anchoring/assembly protein TapA n=1 Tax=Bacillus yapensis TaxID=2492960 RepID=A0A3S0L5M9_9BACI|nr:amyloid fiber anchoring/assembly protein TapA [Bacillus yapensis]RTR27581.1 amyloid fiber anchoring/assembly protein TapA [Bacillus yapensis]TKS94149.1 amyloid fiber anchoring/assembly protein TapA [Bacillus yapensis]
MKHLFNVRKMFILVILLAFVYVFLLTTSLVTSRTEAYYSDSEQWDSVIQVGTWWDKSDLQFTTNYPKNVVSCTPVTIKAGIVNKGFSMIGTTEYEVHYADSLQPNQKIAEGIIEEVKSNSTLNLTYQADKPGFYTFKVFQRPGYQENYESRSVVWSEKIQVTCIDKSAEGEATPEKGVQEGIEQQIPTNEEQKEQIEQEVEEIAQEQQEIVEEQEVKEEQEEQKVQEAEEVLEEQVGDQGQHIQEEQDELEE